MSYPGRAYPAHILVPNHLFPITACLGGLRPPTFVICSLSWVNTHFGSTLVCSSSFRSGYHLHSTPHTPYSWRLRSAPPSLRLSFSWLHFIITHPRLLCLSGSSGCVTVVLLSTSCPHSCFHGCWSPTLLSSLPVLNIVVPPQSLLTAPAFSSAFNILVLSSGAFFHF